MSRIHRDLSLLAPLALLCLAPTSTRAAAEDGVLVEFHFQPVHDAQIAIWLEDENGQFVQDVFVTQATGRMGIGNRPGRWDFLSSWRFPYGPRPGVLPIWAHARNYTYPALVFHDDDVADLESLGWHENTSSPEPFFCRPLSQSEHNTIATDTMTCPSPATFQSDKGRFSPDLTSVYPPRNDLTSFESGHDHADVYTLAEVNDLDAITGATPMGGRPELVTTVVPLEIAQRGPLVARIEINVEHDENVDWEFDRDTDHFVDPRLSNFGIEYLGQPSVVYSIPFDPEQAAFHGTDAYTGYGELDGRTGTIHPPDASISTTNGSGADRLRLFTLNGETFRFGIYSNGLDDGSGPAPTPGDDDGWGSCSLNQLPTPVSIELEPIDFDTVRVHFVVPDQDPRTAVSNAVLYYRTGEDPLTNENSSSAVQQVPPVEQCSGFIEPGQPAWCDVTELFGNYDYQIGVAYEDQCGNLSPIQATSIRTPAQQFAQVDGFCFVATAAWGAPWAARVQALRWFRDLYLKPSRSGMAFVALYYATSPPLARTIAQYSIARAFARSVLQPFTDVAVLLTHPK